MELHIRQLYKNQVINIAIYPYLISAILISKYKCKPMYVLYECQETRDFENRYLKIFSFFNFFPQRKMIKREWIPLRLLLVISVFTYRSNCNKKNLYIILIYSTDTFSMRTFKNKYKYFYSAHCMQKTCSWSLN